MVEKLRNKIIELMKKEDGFTLVELLAVIVILGIIVAIAIPAIGNVMGTAQDGADEAEAELVIDAAQLYVVGENYESDEGIPVTELVSKGYLEANDDFADTTVSVSRDTETGAYTFEYAGYTRGAQTGNPSDDGTGEDQT